MITGTDGILLIPESYAVPQNVVDKEYQHPGSQSREAVGRCPFLWGQSLFILGRLLQDVRNLLRKSEIEYINYLF